MPPKFDDKDQALLDARIARWQERSGPRVGDFVIMASGELRRFTYDWGDDIQTTWKGDGGGSFYMSRDGFMSYSGGLEPAIMKSTLTDTGETKNGHVWFFHHDESRAHNGVHTHVPCRVYKQET